MLWLVELKCLINEAKCIIGVIEIISSGTLFMGLFSQRVQFARFDRDCVFVEGGYDIDLQLRLFTYLRKEKKIKKKGKRD